MNRKISVAPGMGLLALLVLAGNTTARAQGDVSLDGPFAPDEALALVYGSLIWEDARISRYRNFESGRVYVEPLFDAAYTENGVEKHVVIATLTPNPRSQYSCHACSPLLGGAVFRADGDTWTLESVGEIIEFGHAWYGTHSSLTLVRIGPESYGLLHQVSDMNGGYENKRASLIFARDGELAGQFEDNIPEGPGPGACGIPHEQHLRVTVAEAESANGSELYDLIVDKQWNDARCRTLEPTVMTYEGQVCHRISRYEYRDGAYAQVATDLDECTKLPDNVRVSLRG